MPRWPSPEERFWPQVAVAGPDECWEWQGRRNRFGYGWGIRLNGPHRRAHQVAWELHFGTVPKGLCVLHHCDNPPCCNPNHLWLGTHVDNNRDRDRKGRGRGAAGTRNRHAKLTPEQVAEIRRRYSGGWGQRKKLAAEFGITGEMVYLIVSRKAWKGS